MDSLVKYCKPPSLQTFLFLCLLACLRADSAVTTRFNLNSTTTDTQRPWFPYAMQSALIMRVTLALAAEFLTATMPLLDSQLQREGYQQKGEAMRMIRSRLETQESAQRASEDLSVLAGVAMLGSVEVSFDPSPAASFWLTQRTLAHTRNLRSGVPRPLLGGQHPLDRAARHD